MSHNIAISLIKVKKVSNGQKKPGIVNNCHFLGIPEANHRPKVDKPATGGQQRLGPPKPTIKKNSKSLDPGEIIGSNHPCVLAFWHHHHYFFFEQTAAEQQLLGFFQDSTTSRCRVAESCASPADAENLLLILLLKYAMIRLFLQKQLI